MDSYFLLVSFANVASVAHSLTRAHFQSPDAWVSPSSFIPASTQATKEEKEIYAGAEAAP
jgi:hypothetical protein